MDGVAPGCGNDASVGEDETGEDTATVCRKGNVFGVDIGKLEAARLVSSH